MRNLFIITCLMLFSATGYSQLDLNTIKIQYSDVSSNSIITEALQPNMVIIRQQYRLELNGEHYGKNNMPYYGESYSLAIRFAGGMFYLKDVQAPWLFDPDYKRVNASGKYKTEHFATFQRELKDSVYTPIDLEMDKPNYSFPVNMDSTLYKYVYPRSNFGLNIDETAGEKKGYMVWVRAISSIKDSTMVVDVTQSAYAVNACMDSTLISISPEDPEKIIGGIYVVPKYEQGGRVQFLLAGIAVKNISSEWNLQLMVSDLKAVRPTGKSQKTRQDSESDDTEPTLVKTKKK